MHQSTRNVSSRGMPVLLGLAVAFLGATVLVSWYLASLRDVTPAAGYVPMQYNTALGFVVSGLAVAAHCVGRRRLAFWGGGIAAALGSLALAEQVYGRSLFVVQGIFGGSFVGSDAPRMSPLAAICFALAGSVLLAWRVPGTSAPWRRLATGVAASALVAGGFVGLLGYLSNDPSTYGWARLSGLEAHSALGFMGLGLAFFVMVARMRGAPGTSGMPVWAPWVVGAGVAALTVALWTGLTTSDARVQSLAAMRSHEAVMAHTNQLLQGRLRSLERLKRDVEDSGATRNARLTRGAELLLADLPGLVGVAFVEPDGRVRWATGVTPPERLERSLRERPDQRSALRAAREERQTTVSDPGSVYGNDGDLFVFVPVHVGERLVGTLSFEHAIDPLFDSVFADGIGRAFQLQLAPSRGAPFYRSRGSSGADASDAPAMAARIAFGDRLWTLTGRADASFLAAGKHSSNTLILWFGLFLAVALTFVMLKSEALRQRARSLGQANLTIEEHAVSLRAANRSLEDQARHLREAQSQLTRAARDKRYVLDSLSACLIGVDHEGRVVEWNSVSTDLLGAPVGGALGSRFDALALPWDSAMINAAVRECLVSGQRVRRESVRIDVRDRETRVVSITINPTQTEEGRGFAIIGSDVTERQMLELQLQHAQRLESVGTLAAGIAHEINTPMQFVSDNLRFVRESMTPLTGLLALMPEVVKAGDTGRIRPALAKRLAAAASGVDVDFLAAELPTALAETQEGVTRVTSIVRAMKDFSHPGSGGRAPADLNRAIETTVAVARNEYRYYADLETDLEDLPPVDCYVADLNQVFLNLLVNAAHAVRDKVEAGGPRGVIRISTRADGDFVEVRVSDTGTGIPVEARERVFEQFFTTKQVGRGTGLGLSIARAVVVEKHRGTIRFETEPGVGTTFIVRFPRTACVEPARA
jgi:PAS domain S-box-containing protein